VSREIMEELRRVIKDRKESPREGSYVSNLMSKGEDKILEKVGEEAVELILASKSNDRENIIYECSDLIFHTLVLLEYKDIEQEEIYRELKRRRR